MISAWRPQSWQRFSTLRWAECSHAVVSRRLPKAFWCNCLQLNGSIVSSKAPRPHVFVFHPWHRVDPDGCHKGPLGLGPTEPVFHLPADGPLLAGIAPDIHLGASRTWRFSSPCFQKEALGQDRPQRAVQTRPLASANLACSLPCFLEMPQGPLNSCTCLKMHPPQKEGAHGQG